MRTVAHRRHKTGGQSHTGTQDRGQSHTGDTRQEDSRTRETQDRRTVTHWRHKTGGQLQTSLVTAHRKEPSNWKEEYKMGKVHSIKEYRDCSYRCIHLITSTSRSASRPSPRHQLNGRPLAGLDACEKRKITCHCRKLKEDSSVNQPVA